MKPLSQIGDHPQDLFNFAVSEIQAGKDCVLGIITHIEGSSARPVGSPMIICNDGRYAGYVSSGCLDQDIATQSLETLRTGQTREVRYGKGSPYIDLRLPCGGGLDVLFVPRPNEPMLRSVCETLERRQLAELNLGDHRFIYSPKLRLMIFGQTQEADRLVEMAKTSNLDVELNPDLENLEADRWTAIILLFHDHDKEIPILKAALETQAFYIGAMGSRKSHATRLEALKQEGVTPENLTQIKGPIGLVPSTRDAGRLAISVLAEIFETDRLRVG